MSQGNDVKGKTWRDFPNFYNSAFVHDLAGKEKWTVSDNTKRPIDMRALINKGKVWGVAWDRGYNPLVDLETLKNTIPNAVNNAFYLDAELDGYVVLDIEPKCPDVIKKEMLKLPYLYGEISMSGKGIHLVFALPKVIWNKYPVIHNKLALKEQHGYYEILLSNHFVTFTRNDIGEPYDPKPISEFEKVFEKLASEAKESVAAKEVIVEDISTDNIPMFNKIMTVLSAQNYKRKPDYFSNDMSKYEFGMASFYYHALKRLLSNNQFKNIEYLDEQCAVILYEILKKKLEFRPKHEEQRNGLPWLLYVATQLIGKSNLSETTDNTD